MSKACLVDLTRCIGCRGCQVTCKGWNNLAAETTEFFARSGGYQNPPALSPKTNTLITYNEIKDSSGRINWVFSKRQCMHCLEPSCVSACLVKALEKKEDGPVVYHENLCMGCRYCMIACPFDIPKFEYEKAIPSIRKCTFCFDRQEEGEMPACAKACTTGAILFGDRDELLDVARSRIYRDPNDRYVHKIYGEHEVGGTAWMYISDVPFEDLGFPTNLGTDPYPQLTSTFLGAVPQIIILWAGLLTGFHWFVKRREEVAKEEITNTEKEE